MDALQRLKEFNAELDAVYFDWITTGKNIVREIHQQPGANVRVGEYGKHIRRHNAIRKDRLVSSANQPVLPKDPGVKAAMPRTKGISISKGEYADAGLMNRIQAVTHESGHGDDRGLAKLQVRANKINSAMGAGKLKQPYGIYGSKTQRAADAILKSEQTANRHGISRMVRAGASSREISDYKQNAKRAYNAGYKLPAVNWNLNIKAQRETGAPVQRKPSISEVKSIYQQHPYLRRKAFSSVQKGILRLLQAAVSKTWKNSSYSFS